MVGARGAEGTRKTRPIEATKQGLTETQVAIMEQVWIRARSSAYVLRLFGLGYLRDSQQ